MQSPLDRKPVEELIQQILDSPRSKLCPRYFKWGTILKFAMGFAHPFAGLLAIVPNVFGMGQDAGETFGAFALVHREPLGAALPRCLGNHFELVRVCNLAIAMEASRAPFQRAFWYPRRYSGLQLFNS